MYRQPVYSSDIRSIGYENGTLEIEFNSGGVYQYYNVPSSIAQGLLSAQSHGRYFHRYINEHYQYRRLC